ncbi:N-acetylmuramoyl-L-alanine amidase [Streptomyces griseus]|uniref:N-acetylmuramoyl-L-alanine amidase n=1 Tax=Streptomyces griseus TaxID=1911 RepID=UPI003665E09B
MATALSPDRLLSALRAEGVKVVEYRSWRTHRRPASAGAFGPIHGVMIHHTVTSGTANSVELCYNGHSALPGPLCHGVIAKDGTVHLVSAGRANHAGRGDDDVLRQVQAESYDRGKTITPNEANTDGNRHFYGFECVNLGDGRDPWPAAQREAIVRASAAICRAYGWSARSVIGHREWQPGKVDPRTGQGGVDVAPPVLRQRIDERLAHPASWSPGAEPTTPSKPTAPPKQEDPNVALTPEQVALLKKISGDLEKVKTRQALDGWGYRNAAADQASKEAGDRIPDAYGYLVQTHETVTVLAAAVADLTAAVTAALTKES